MPLTTFSTSTACFVPTTKGTYSFVVTVSDNRGQVATDSITILANGVPVVRASGPDTVAAQTAAFVFATATDPEGQTLTYNWIRRGGSGPGVSLFNADTPTANFTPIVVGRYVFDVIVSDGIGSSSARVSVSVVPASTQADDHPNNFDNVTPNDYLPTDGSTVNAAIEYARDVDFFRFDADAGAIYSLELASTGELSPTTLSLAVFDPLRRLVSSGVPARGAQAIRGFRPQTSGAYYVQVSTVGSVAVGGYQITIQNTGISSLPPPPRLSVSFARTGSSLDATIRTSGTTVPISALTLLLEYDSRHLALLNALPGPAASSFNLAPQQFTLPFLGLGFQSKEAGFVALPAGILAQVSFGVNEDSDKLDNDLAIGRAVATFPAGFGDALRPTANPGRAPFFSAARTSRKGKISLYPDPLAPPNDNLKPFLRLDARASTDSNANTQPLSYRWTQIAGPKVVLSDPSSPIATFVPVTDSGRYTFQLFVDNGVLEAPARQVVLSVDETGSIPVAAGRVRNGANGSSSGALDAPLVVTRGTSVFLDASRSTHPNAALRQNLQYTWTQLAGLPSLPLTNVTTISLATSSLLGTYKVQLSVADTTGRTGLAETLSFVVAPASQAPLSLRLVSAASGISATAADSDEGDPTPPAPLRVSVGSNVTLRAQAFAPAVTTGQTKLVFRWKQLSGPVDNAKQADGQTATNTQSSLTFTAKVPGLRRYRCEVAEQDLGGNPTGQAVSRVIAVAVDSIAFVVPRARASVGAAGSGLAQASSNGSAATTLPTGTVVLLDARNSSTPSPEAAVYHWVQIDGPPVTLSNPFASLTTFIVPDLGDLVERRYVFQLFVQDGELASENVAAVLSAVPRSRRTIVLERGLNLVAVQVDPSTPDHTYRVSDLLRDSGAAWVATLDSTDGHPRFRTFVVVGDNDAPVVTGAGAYLIHSPAARALFFEGPSWSNASRNVVLGPGLNAIAYPLGVPAGERASNLVERTGAAFLLQLSSGDPPGRGRFQLYIDGLSPDTILHPGRGYFLSVPASRSLTLPTGEATN